ncbi:UNVERIFIED_CONTAM: hypothetical protein FKN15_072872 [Acipenser sinensis]
MNILSSIVAGVGIIIYLVDLAVCSRYNSYAYHSDDSDTVSPVLLNVSLSAQLKGSSLSCLFLRRWSSVWRSRFLPSGANRCVTDPKIKRLWWSSRAPTTQPERPLLERRISTAWLLPHTTRFTHPSLPR